MFIRKKDYKELCDRLTNLECAVPAFVEATDAKLCGFATDIEELSVKVAELEDEKDAVEQFREFGKSLNDGLTNIMKF